MRAREPGYGRVLAGHGKSTGRAAESARTRLSWCNGPSALVMRMTVAGAGGPPPPPLRCVHPPPVLVNESDGGGRGAPPPATLRVYISPGPVRPGPCRSPHVR